MLTPHSNASLSIRIYFMKSRSLFPLRICNGMRESRTLHTAIFDRPCVCLEGVQGVWIAGVLFVSNRLKSKALLPDLLPLIHNVKGATNVFGMERVFPIWGFARGVGTTSASTGTLPLVLYCHSDIH
jgi:hypothetical protein